MDAAMRRKLGYSDLDRWFEEAKADDNPYLSAWFAVYVANERDGVAFGVSIDEYQARKALIGKYAWAVPCRAALEAIAKLSPLVEPGAGTGYWTWLLRKLGADIIAFDRHPPVKHRDDNQWHPQTETFVVVRPGGPEVVADNSRRTLFLCWPPYGEPFAADCLRCYSGERFAFVGENDGCTGDQEFFDMLGTDWTPETEIDLPQWDGIHDYLTVYHRRNT